jgi:hypothetical protein
VRERDIEGGGLVLVDDLQQYVDVELAALEGSGS